MKNRELVKFFSTVMTMFVLVGLTAGFTLQAAAASLSENGAVAYEYAAAGNEASLQDYLGNLTPEARVAVARELAVGLSGRQIADAMPLVIKVMTVIQPTNGMEAMLAAVESSGAKQAVIKASMQGLIAGALAHPSLTTEGERLAAAARTAEAAAAALIRFAEAEDRIDAASVAFAAVRGAVEGIAPGLEQKEQLQTVAEALARGGVGAALEPNKPAVARAMMLALASLKDIEIRRAAISEIAAGGEAAGGEPAVAVMTPLRDQMEAVLMIAPMPIAPEINLVLDPDEVSPF